MVNSNLRLPRTTMNYNAPHPIKNCYNCKHLVLNTKDIAITRLNHKATVNMECKLADKNSEKYANHDYLMARCNSREPTQE